MVGIWRYMLYEATPLPGYNISAQGYQVCNISDGYGKRGGNTIHTNRLLSIPGTRASTYSEHTPGMYKIV